MKKWNGLLNLSATLAILCLILSGCDNSESAGDVANEAFDIRDSDVTSRVRMGVVDNQNYINDVNAIVRGIEGVHKLHNHLSAIRVNISSLNTRLVYRVASRVKQ